MNNVVIRFLRVRKVRTQIATRRIGLALSTLVFALGFGACTTLPDDANTQSSTATPPPQNLALAASTSGIQITAARLSAAGYMIDVRYRVLDTEKAAALFKPKVLAYLQEQASGAKFLIPDTAKLGLLRQKAQQSKMDRIYFMMFANPGKFVKPGDHVLLVMGDTQVGEMVVQ